MKLATTTGDFLHYCNNDPSEAVRAYIGTGFRHLDYSFYNAVYPDAPFMGNTWKSIIADAGNTAAKYGFDFVQAHAPGNNLFCDEKELDFFLEGVKRSIVACSMLGIPKLVLHQGHSPEFTYPKDNCGYNKRNRSVFEKLYPTMEKYGVSVLIENTASANMGTMCFPRNAVEMLEFLHLCNHPLLGCCWDVGHANMENPDQYTDIVSLGDHLKAVHIQDNLGFRDDHLAPFMGTLDIDAVMQGLIDNGFISRGGYFTFEAENILLTENGWPNRRHMKFAEVALCSKPPLELKHAAIRFLYEIGKSILTAYNCFEP